MIQAPGGQSSNLPLNVVYYFNSSANYTSVVALKQLFSYTGV